MLRLKEFANRLGISYSTAHRMFCNGQIPGAFKLPTGTIIIPKESIDAIRNDDDQIIDLIFKICLERFGEKRAEIDIDIVKRILTGGIES